jgi:hypothetical protein
VTGDAVAVFSHAFAAQADFFMTRWKDPRCVFTIFFETEIPEVVTETLSIALVPYIHSWASLNKI